jgi:hypothetical protein
VFPRSRHVARHAAANVAAPFRPDVVVAAGRRPPSGAVRALLVAGARVGIAAGGIAAGAVAPAAAHAVEQSGTPRGSGEEQWRGEVGPGDRADGSGWSDTGLHHDGLVLPEQPAVAVPGHVFVEDPAALPVHVPLSGTGNGL